MTKKMNKEINIVKAETMDARKKLAFRAGDTVKVWQKIKEGDKFRLQAFEGLVLARKHGAEAGATFTVRKVASGVGMERIFPLYSPVIDKIEILRTGKVRRSKLYFVREKAAKEIRKSMKQVMVRTKDENTDTKVVAAETKKEEPTPAEAAK